MSYSVSVVIDLVKIDWIIMGDNYTHYLKECWKTWDLYIEKVSKNILSYYY